MGTICCWNKSNIASPIFYNNKLNNKILNSSPEVKNIIKQKKLKCKKCNRCRATYCNYSPQIYCSPECKLIEEMGIK
jgi:hypothetical protein